MQNRTSFYLPSFHKICYLFLALSIMPAIGLAEKITEKNSPVEVVKAMSYQLEQDLISRQDEIKTNPQITSEIITKTLNSYVNFSLMSRYVLGKNWKKASTQQKDEFAVQFKALLIHFYSKAFNNYLKTNRIEKDMITFLPFRSKPRAKYAKVKTEIKLSAQANKLKIQYSLYNGKKTGWKIYDLSIEGISLVTSYRSSFKQIINKEKIDGLLKHMQKKLGSPSEAVSKDTS